MQQLHACAFRFPVGTFCRCKCALLCDGRDAEIAALGGQLRGEIRRELDRYGLGKPAGRLQLRRRRRGCKAANDCPSRAKQMEPIVYRRAIRAAGSKCVRAVHDDADDMFVRTALRDDVLYRQTVEIDR